MALILIIDDSPSTRKAIRKVVKDAGYDSIEAADGKEGLIATAQKPDCILLDLIMPEVDGIEVLKALRNQNSEIPVIVLSADIQEIVREECLELGAKAFINKPMLRHDLHDTIKRVLEQ